MSGEPEHAPMNPDSIVEGVVAIETEMDPESFALDCDESRSLSSAATAECTCSSAGATSHEPTPVASEVATLHNLHTNSLEAGPEEARALQEDQCTPTEDGRHAEGEVSDPTLAGEETTSLNKPREVGKNVVVLQSKSNAPGAQCSVYLVGTAHVSQESCDEVQAVIRNVKPNVVFLELCSSRVAMLMPQNLKVPTFEEMINMYKKKEMNPFGIIYSWFLARIADKMEVFPGSEFRVAYEEACASGARVVLGDRPVQIEDLKDTDMVTAIIQEMSKSFPSLMDTLVHERDLYMTVTLRGVAQSSSSVVAVIGKGHLRGISDNWETDISIEELLLVPEKKPSWFSKPIVRWGSVAVAVAGLSVFLGVHYNRKS